VKIRAEMEHISGKDLTVVEEDLPENADIAVDDNAFLLGLSPAQKQEVEAQMKKDTEARKRIR
jgi:hypothetical protein